MVLTFCIVLFIMMMNFVWRYIDELVGKGLDFGVIVELLFYAMANTMPMGLPLATLLAAIMTMGNLGENYELLAMKSAGMSLPRILRPLIIVVAFVAVGSFFIANNLVPYANKQMMAILYDIKQQKQTLEFKDGIFFNGIDNMSIRVEHQDPVTGQLFNVLIYDTRDPGGNMTTTMAESGYIRISDDKQFLLVTLYNGETYETTRNYRWSEENNLRHHIFAEQNGAIKMDGFAFERSDVSLFNSSQTKNVTELQTDIDSLAHLASINTRRSYQPLLESYLFTLDRSVMGLLDTVEVERVPFEQLDLTDSVFNADYHRSFLLWDKAATQAENSRSILSFNESTAKDNLNQLYKSQVEWHRKIALPFSVVIFFLIGAPLGAIIRRGGLGMPTVVSVLFFVFYYIVSMMGEKMAKEGSMGAFEGMWLSSIILFPIAIYLTYKATNDSNLLNVDWYYMKYVAVRDWLRARFGKKSSKKLSAKNNG